MNQRYLIFIAFLFLGFPLFSQYDIDICIKNYSNDTLIIGQYYADKQIVVDTLFSRRGKFEFSGKDTIAPGVYFFLTKPDNNYALFFVNGLDNDFDIKWDIKDMSKITFKGSKDNEVFVDYLKFLEEQKPKAKIYRERLAVADSLGKKDPEAEKLLEEVDKKVLAEQKRIVAAYPNTITARYIKSGIAPDIPEFEGEDKELKTYLAYKKHYFDNLDLGDVANLRTPYIDNRVSYYLEKLTSVDPDSIIVSVDYLLSKMEPAKETFRYYLSHFLNKYAQRKIIGYDKVYVHLVDEYYSKGKAPWVNEENLKKIETQANNLRSILIGNKFPDITTYLADDTPFRLWDLESEYTVLVFWAYNCGHCKKAMPHIVKFYDEFQDKGVTLVTVCTKGDKKTEKCKEAVPKEHMEKFINTFDKYQRYRRKAYITTTPKIFILDKDKNIILKDFAATALKTIMEEVMKADAEKKKNNKKD